MAPASETAYDWGWMDGDPVINSDYPLRDLPEAQSSLRVEGPPQRFHCKSHNFQLAST
jgi:hypothetical protein